MRIPFLASNAKSNPVVQFRILAGHFSKLLAIVCYSLFSRVSIFRIFIFFRLQKRLSFQNSLFFIVVYNCVYNFVLCWYFILKKVHSSTRLINFWRAKLALTPFSIGRAWKNYELWHISIEESWEFQEFRDSFISERFC